MARRTRSFLFDNISKRLVQNTNKTAKEINTRVSTNTTANTDILTKAEVETVISNTSIATLSDTTVANVANEQILQYNANTAKWENETLDLSAYATNTDLADYSNTAQMNTAIAASNTLMTTYVDDQVANVDFSAYSTTTQMNTAIASSNTAMKNYVDAEVAGVVNSAPSTLDTLNELAAALGDDANFATTTSTALGNRLRIDVSNQSLTGTEKTNALTNLGITATVAELNILDGVTATASELNKLDGVTATTAELNYVDGVTSNIQTQLDAKGTSSFSGAYADLTGKPSLFSGAYADLSGKPTIPTNNNQLTNGAGYITTTSANNSLVQLGAIQLYNNEKTTYTAVQGLLIYDQAGDNCLNIYNDNLSRWVKIWDDSNDGASSGLDADLLDGQHGSYYLNYNNLSNKPTIPTNNNQLTNGAGYITSTVSGDLDIVGDVKAAGMVRGTGWWNTNSSDRSGYAVEIGYSSGEGYLLSYSRTASAYGAMNFVATSFNFDERGGTTTIEGNEVWHAGNDGSGSGLDADTVDGIQASSFLRSNTSDTMTGDLTISNGGTPLLKLSDTSNGGGGGASGIIRFVNTNGNAIGIGYTADNTASSDLIISTNAGSTYGGYLGLTAGAITDATADIILDAKTLARIQTPSGYVTIGPQNGTYTHFSTDRANFYFNKTMIVDGGGIRAYDASTDARFPLYYDYDDTSYYVNPAGTSRFNVQYSNEHSTLASHGAGLRFWNSDSYKIYMSSTANSTWGGSVSNAASSDYNMYFRMSSGTNRGFVFKNNTTAVAQIDGSGIATFSGVNGSGQYLNVKYNATGGGGIALYDNEGTVNTYLYGNGAGEGGLLDNDGSWFCRGRTGTSANIFYCNGNNELYVYTSYVRAIGSFRAPIYYDFNNTSYYAHLDSTGDSIRAAGDIVAYYSDERLKDIHGNIENALDKVCTLDGFYYTPNEIAQKLGYKKEKTRVGLSAQQVQAILPEVIKDCPADNKYMTVDYAKIVPLLVEAIKELKSEIEELKK